MNGFCLFDTVCLLQLPDSFRIRMRIGFSPVLRIDYSHSLIFWAVINISRK